MTQKKESKICIGCNKKFYKTAWNNSWNWSIKEYCSARCRYETRGKKTRVKVQWK